MTYVAPQSVAVAMRDHLAAQLSEVKQINGDKFFERLGQKVAPAIDSAMSTAITPLAKQIGDAVGELKQNSQTGIQDILKQFSETIHGGAGTEMRELRESLAEVRRSMEMIGSSMGQSGENFAAQLGQAAGNLKIMIEETGQRLGEQSAANARQIDQMRSALKDIFDQAGKKVEENLANAAKRGFVQIGRGYGARFAKA